MMTEPSVSQLVDSALRAYHAGDALQAESLCNQALSEQPECAQALHLLALILSQRGEHPKARDFLNRAIEANPLSPEYRTDLAVVLESLNLPDDALAGYRVALDVQPDFSPAQIRLAALLGKLRRFDDSIAAWRAAAEICPDNAEILNNLGATLYAAGQFDPALLEFAKALEIRPDFAEAYNNVGNALFSRGDADLAVAAYQKAVAINPTLVDAQTNLANALNRRGRHAEALQTHARAADARPDHAPTQISAGDAFAALGLWDAAADSYQRALQLDPQNAAVAVSLGNVLLAKKDLDGAVAAYRRALQLQPHSADAANNLGLALKEQGLIDESLDCCENAMNFQPANPAIHSNLIYLLSFHPGYDAVEISRQQRQWNNLHAAPLQNRIRPHDNDPATDRRLKIGYVSPDMRRPPIGQNLFPLLAEHDRSQFDVCVYSNAPRQGALSQIMHGHTDVWRDVAEVDDDALADLIRNDSIDILVDLAQHTAGNRLLVFARKPAPVQATYLGNCVGAGLETIDYRFSDPYLDPPEADVSVYSEQTVRLPETYWCYVCAGRAPEPSSPPSERTGFITFGCLNNFAKVSPGSLDLWAEILKAVPRSRLILHSYPGSHLDAVRQRFAAADVSPDRIEFLTRQPWSGYIQTYERIDIALDPFPFGGGITSCDALWMGVPVVSLIGQTVAGRTGRSILSNIGLSELAARRTRQYVQTAVTLANSPARLADLRRTLRHRMLTSPLTNARRFARNVENAYRQMWLQWVRSHGNSPR